MILARARMAPYRSRFGTVVRSARCVAIALTSAHRHERAHRSMSVRDGPTGSRRNDAGWDGPGPSELVLLEGRPPGPMSAFRRQMPNQR